MTLNDYLSAHDISPAEFGRLVGASEHGVRKWQRGERVPRPDAMRLITLATEGAVTANDFITPTPKEAA